MIDNTSTWDERSVFPVFPVYKRTPWQPINYNIGYYKEKTTVLFQSLYFLLLNNPVLAWRIFNSKKETFPAYLYCQFILRLAVGVFKLISLLGCFTFVSVWYSLCWLNYFFFLLFVYMIFIGYILFDVITLDFTRYAFQYVNTLNMSFVKSFVTSISRLCASTLFLFNRPLYLLLHIISPKSLKLD